MTWHRLSGYAAITIIGLLLYEPFVIAQRQSFGWLSWTGMAILALALATISLLLFASVIAWRDAARQQAALFLLAAVACGVAMPGITGVSLSANFPRISLDASFALMAFALLVAAGLCKAPAWRKG